MDKDRSGGVDFYEFACAMSALSPRANIEEKSNFVFQIYDVDGNGRIEHAELKEVVSASLNEKKDRAAPTAKKLSGRIDALMSEFDVNGDQCISRDEFLAEVRRDPELLDCVNVDIDKLLTPSP
jgi:Ca2+-binding EF-hand superfamily protein